MMIRKSMIKDVMRLVQNRRIPPEVGVFLVKRLQSEGLKPSGDAVQRSEEIAVIGMSGRFPQASDLNEFWRLLSEGRDLVSQQRPSHWDQAVTISARFPAGFLDDVPCFDPQFFNISVREAEVMEPQQRLFLQEAWRAFEDAGIPARLLSGMACGVFVGCAPGDYLQVRSGADEDGYALTGGGLSILAARISYFLNLKGPSMAIDTACSSSLTAVCLACESLRSGSCEMAVAGGVSLMTQPGHHNMLTKAGMLSPQGRCASFAQGADGMVPAEAVGVVVLKLLTSAQRDGDPIRAVIKGFGTNQDGKTNGITSPSAPAQAALIREVLQKNNINPETITYVEGHGTGTELGDPIEVQALTAAYEGFTAKRRFCALGSVKSNMGHALPASGITGLIKLILCLEHRTLVPSLHYDLPNPHIDFAQSPFFVNRQLQPWLAEGGLLRGAVSSFGMSGTNAHLVVEEAPAPVLEEDEPGPFLMPISAKSSTALGARVGQLIAFLGEVRALAPIAHTLIHRRSFFAKRLVFLADTQADLVDQLQRWFAHQEPQRGAGLSKKACKEKAATWSGMHPNSPAERRQQLQALAALFLDGYDGALSQLAREPKGPIPRLPVYPFDKLRCWLDPAPTATAQPQLAQASGLQRCDFTFSGDEFFFSEHVIAGRKILPGVAYLDLVLRAAQRLRLPFGGINDLVWLQPLAVEGPVTVTVSFEGSDSRFTIFSQDGEQTRQHAEGALTARPGPRPNTVDIAALVARTQAQVGDCYQRFERLGVVYGPQFRVVTSLRGNGQEALATMKAPSAADLAAFILHPGLVDGMLQTGLGGADAPESHAELPFSVRAVTLFEPLTGASHAVVRSYRNEAGTRHADALLTNELGEVILEVLGVSFRALPRQKSLEKIQYFGTGWEDAALTANFQPRTLLIMSRDLEAAQDQALAYMAHWAELELYLLQAGPQVEQPDFHHYCADWANPGQMAEVFNRLQQAEALPDAVVIQGLAMGKVETENVLAAFAQLLALTQTLAPFYASRPLNVLVLFEKNTQAIAPALEGCLRTINREHPQLVFRLVAMTHDTPFDRVVPEIGERLAGYVSLSASQRRRQRIQAVYPAEPRCAPPKGTYIISGGVSALGLATASWLCRSLDATVVLFGRRPQHKVATILAQQSLSSSQVHYYQMDVRDETGLRRLQPQILAAHGPIRGIFHCAGVLADSPTLGKDPHHARDVIQTKLQGALSLTRVFAGPGIRCVFFSSYASLLGNPGQADYALANGCLDRLAELGDGGNTVSVHFPFVDGGGMKLPPDILAKLWAHGPKPLLLSELPEVLAAAMQGGLHRLIPYKGDPQLLMELYRQAPVSTPHSPISSLPDSSLPDQEKPTGSYRLQQVSAAVATDRQAAVMARLRPHFAKALKLENHQVEDLATFEDLGLDSFMNLRILKDLESDFGALSKTLLFEKNSLQKLAEYMVSQGQAEPMQAVVEPMAEPVVEPLPVASVGIGAIKEKLLPQFAAALKLDAALLDTAKPFEDYGLDSFMNLRLLKELETDFGALSKTLLFEVNSIDRLAEYLAAGIRQVTPSKEQVDPSAANASQVLVIHIDALPTHPELASTHRALIELEQNESVVARGTTVIAPNLFFTHSRMGCFYFNEREQTLLVYGYAGRAEDYQEQIEELLDYANSRGVILNLINTTPVTKVGNQPFTATPIGVNQRILDLPRFSLEGKPMRRLRYLVSKFEKQGSVRTEEFRNTPTSAETNRAIARLIDAWCAERSQVNPFVLLVREEILAGRLPKVHRVFLTYLDDQLQNAVIVSHIPSLQGYLMDLEFYAPEMPLGGLECAIHRMIALLVSEGAQLLSLGGTFGPKVGDSPHQDSALVDYLDGLRESGDFGAGNYQFKRKFRPSEETIFLCRPEGTAPERVNDVFMMIADPQPTRRDLPLHPTPIPDGPRDSPSTAGAKLPMSIAEGSRLGRLQRAGFNPLHLMGREVEIDFNTDSWAQLDLPHIAERMDLLAARGPNERSPEDCIAELFGVPHVQMTASGRMAEAFLFAASGQTPGPLAQAPMFPTFIGHALNHGFVPDEYALPQLERRHGRSYTCGNLDLARLRKDLDEGRRFAFVALELGNNAAGGHGVSLDHLATLSQWLAPLGTPLILDVTRALENAFSLLEHESDLAGVAPLEVVARLCAPADLIWGSLCKDFSLDKGGFVATRNPDVFRDLKAHAGLHGSGLNARERRILAQGLQDRTFFTQGVRARMDSALKMWRGLKALGWPVVEPVGGHCVLVDARAVPGFERAVDAPLSFVAWLYLHTGIRAGLHNGGLKPGPFNAGCVRFALPVGMPEQVLDTALARLSRLVETNPLPFLLEGRRQASIPVKFDPHQLQHPVIPEGLIPPSSTKSAQLPSTQFRADEAVAIIGMAGRFPQAPDLETFWQNLVSGLDSIGEMPPERLALLGLDAPLQPHWGGYLSDIHHFDRGFFGVGEVAARFMDPQERLFLETSWTTIEDAGYLPNFEIPDTVGVYVGAVWNHYQLLGLGNTEGESPNSFHWSIANHVSHFMNWDGPSMCLDTACSSSLTAIHLACLDIRRGACRAALAGGVNLELHPYKTFLLSATKQLSRDGRCRTFGAGGDGYGAGEGVGAVLLKSRSHALADGDRIHALICNTDTNHGGKTSGVTVPNPKAQAALLGRCLDTCGLKATDIGFVEVNGVGTAMGDAIELEALTQTYKPRGAATGSIALGSVKSVVGHLESAAGIAALIKVVLQLKHRQLFPSLHCEQPNEFLGLETSPFYVNRHLQSWRRREGQPLRAGINAFGAGGTNVHLIVEEAPTPPLPEPKEGHQLIVLSAGSDERLRVLAARHRDFLNGSQGAHICLSQIAYTLNLRRTVWPSRLAVVVGNVENWREALTDYLDGRQNDAWFSGREGEADPDLFRGSAGKVLLDDLIKSGNLTQLARLWCKGYPIPLEKLSPTAGMATLPTYPFVPEPVWVKGVRGTALPVTPQSSVPQSWVETKDAPPTQTDHVAPIARFVGGLLKTDPTLLSLDSTLHDLGFDSLTGLRVLQFLHERCELKLPLTTVFKWRTLRDVQHTLQDHGIHDFPKDVVTASAEPTGEVPTRFPLSEGQKALWLLHAVEPSLTGYNLPNLFRLDVATDLDRLEIALGLVVAHHPMLRTLPLEANGELLQETQPPAGLSMVRRSLEEHDETRLAAELEAAAFVPFALGREPLVRVTLFSTPRELQLLVTFHHLISDGISLGLFLQDTRESYAALAEGRSPRLAPQESHFATYVTDQAAFLKSEKAAQLARAWETALTPLPPPLELLPDYERLAQAGQSGAVCVFDLEPALLARLNALARAHETSLFMLLLTAYGLLLKGHSGQDHLIVAVPSSGRPGSTFRNIIGFFVNILPMSLRLPKEKSFLEVLAKVAETVTNALEWSDYPFSHVVRDLGQHTQDGKVSLYNTGFGFQNWVQDLDQVALAAGSQGQLHLYASQFEEIYQKGELDLGLEITDLKDRVVALIKYNPQRFSRGRIRGMAGHFQTLLTQIAVAPETHLAAFSLMDQATRTHFLDLCFNRDPQPHAHRHLHHQFEDRVARDGAAIALIFEDQLLSYDEVNRHANRLARKLRALGVGPEVLVGVAMERSPVLPISLLAVLKSGGAYVPLDPSFPAERLAYMVADANTPVVLSHAPALARLPSISVPILQIDQVETFAEELDESNLDVAIDPLNLIYTMYTSGSTGNPKGVPNTHEGVSNRIRWGQAAYPLTTKDTLFQKTPYSFDISVWEVFWTLSTGARLVIARPEGHRDARYLKEQIKRFQITVIHFVPSMLQLFLEEPNLGELTSLKRVFCTGEAVTREHQKRFFNCLPEAGLTNLYGPTEAAIEVSFWDCEPDHRANVPIGTAITNVGIYVLDQNLNPLPPGIAGQLFISGICLGRGYHRQPRRAAGFFIPDPFVGDERAGARMYASGDMARFLNNQDGGPGALEFLGRLDFQVKIRGYRIELDEIATVVAAHPGVVGSAILAREDVPGDLRLVAYIQPAEGAVLDTIAIKAALANKLPQYMMPSAFVVLDNFPLTPSGKLDRKALPAPDGGEARTGLRGPRDFFEEAVAAIWREILGVAALDVHDNFFELGGHSLLLTKTQARIRTYFQVDLPMTVLFQYPTLEDLARTIKSETMPKNEVQNLTRRSGDSEGPTPLSYAQSRLWLVDSLIENTFAYNMPFLLQLKGSLCIKSLIQSFQALVDQHENLRTCFPAEDGVPRQKIGKPGALFLRLIDAACLGDAGSEAILKKVLHEPFNISEGPLFKVTLVRHGAQDHLLVVNQHHIIGDGWSLRIIYDHLMQTYPRLVRGGELNLPELPVQYADFALWQSAHLSEERLGRALTYWKGLLADTPRVLSLPLDFKRPAQQRYHGDALLISLPTDAVAALQETCLAHGLTRHMILAAVFADLLGRYAGQEVVSLGIPVANRDFQELEGLTGLFINTLVLPVDLREDPSPLELCQRTRKATLEVLTHQDMPFEKLLEELDLERDQSIPPLIQVMFSYEEIIVETADMPLVEVISREPDLKFAKFDLTLYAYYQELPEGTRLSLRLEYNSDLFRSTTIERLFRHFTTLLETYCRNPHAARSAISIINEAERRQLLVDFNNTAAEVEPGQTLHQVFSTYARAHGDTCALLDGTRTLSYAEMDRESNRLARRLRLLGAQSDQLVGVCLQRSIEMVLALHAVLKAGCAYVPLDPSLPADRLAFMVEDAGVRLVLTAKDCPDLPGTSAELLYLDEGLSLCSGDSPEPLAVQVHPKQLAYTIYTSGSTGRPKGAGVAHDAVFNRIHWMQKAYPLEPGFRVLQKTPYSFDVSVWEFFWPFVAGATLVVARPEGHKDPDYLRDLIRETSVHTLHFVPSMLRIFLAQEGLDELTSLKQVFCSGEALGMDVVDRFFQRMPKVALNNLYGPTEAAIDVTAFTCLPNDPRHTVPIGKPIDNIAIYILDRHLNPVPIGMPGQLFIAGIGLARGYHLRPGLTAQTFIANPYHAVPGERMYRSGDLACFHEDGAIDFLGRTDHQVKLRGLRIELGEIEHAILQVPAVEAVVTMVHRDAHGEQHLIAYAQTNLDAASLEATATPILEAHLPSYMMPSLYVCLQSMPLTPSGKIDRKALPAPQFGVAGTAEPCDDALSRDEELIADIWKAVLRIDHVGASDHFFKLGGHSLLATRVLSRIRTAFGVDINLNLLFEQPVLRELAETLRELKGQAPKEQRPELVALTRNVGDRVPLSFGQSRLWLLHQMDVAGAQYSLPLLLRIEGLLDLEALQAAFGGLIQRHESLRTRFIAVDDHPYQHIDGESSFRVTVEKKPDDPEALKEEISHLVHLPFDLEQGPLLRVHLFQTGEQTHLMLLNMHHIISDGWSMRVLFSELAHLYKAHREHLPVALEPLPLQYADFSQWQHAWLRGRVLQDQLQYWTRHLEEIPTLMELPWDKPRPKVQTFNGNYLEFDAPEDMHGRLVPFLETHNVTLYMLLLSVYAALLARYSGQEQVCIGTPIAGRTDRALENLIGFFVNTLALHIRLSGNLTVAALIEQVRQTCLGAYAHQDLPFEQLVDYLDLERNQGVTPLFQTMFSVEGGNNDLKSTDLEFGNLAVFPESFDYHVAKFDLSLFVTEQGGSMRFRIEYNTDLFEAATITAMGDHLLGMLAAFLEQGDSRLPDLDILTAEEKCDLLSRWCGVPSPYPREKNLVQLVQEQANRSGDATALIHGEHRLSYLELIQKAAVIGTALRKQGVCAGDMVAMCMPRHEDTIIVILGILWAGAAYVPLDVKHPMSRLQYLVDDARAKILITNDTAQPLPEVERVMVRAQMDATSGQTLPAVDSHPLSPAYVMFTSGTTGQPKGVCVTHRGPVRIVCNNPLVRIEPRHVLSHLSALAFDASTFEIWGALLKGAMLVIFPEGQISLIPELLQKHEVTISFFTTQLFNLLTDDYLPQLGGLEHLIFGGEAASPEHVARFREVHPHVRAINGYGPTENTVFTTFADLQASAYQRGPISLGVPLGNTRVYVVDRNLNPVPPGVFGELVTSGDGLAQGYLYQPGRTAMSFVPNPFSPDGILETRLYRTGDRVRFHNGQLAFAGRIDRQVKLRGFRIELGEIESAMMQVEQVSQGLVITTMGGSGLQLVGYLTWVGDGPDIAAKVREHLLQNLPSYMVPRFIVPLRAFPLNANGKIDLRNLPKPIDPTSEAHRRPLAQGLEALGVLWTNLLKETPDGPDSNFFELGGHSLAATRLVGQIRRIFGVTLSLTLLFEFPTLSGQWEQIQKAQTGLMTEPPPLRSVSRSRSLPLSYSQERLWFLHCLAPDAATYHVPISQWIEGPLRPDLLDKALQLMIQRHETLRTVFRTENDEPVQVILKRPKIRLEILDFAKVPAPIREETLFAALSLAAVFPFELEHQPPVRFCLYRAAPDRFLFLVNMHHILTDGWSMSNFFDELFRAYGALLEGKEVQFAELPIQYADYAVHQRDLLERRLVELTDWWLKHLDGRTHVLSMPTDYPRPLQIDNTGGAVVFYLKPETTARLKTFCTAHGHTPYMTLLAAFMGLLSRYAGQDEICVGTPVANRTQPEVEHLIGFFTNTLLMYGDMRQKPNFRDFCQQIRAGVLGAFAHSDMPFERLVGALQPERDMSRNPLFQAMFQLLNLPKPSDLPAPLSAEPIHPDDPQSQFDMSLTIFPVDEGWYGQWIYATVLFRPDFAEQLVRHFQTYLDRLLELPDTPMHQLAIMSEEERVELVSHFNKTETDYSGPAALHRYLPITAEQFPRQIALKFQDTQLTYREMEAATNRLAAHLRAHGIGADMPVGVCLHRSHEMVLALHAILKAGGAYVPLDPTLPESRLHFMVKDADLSLILTSKAHRRLLADGTAELLCMEDLSKVEPAKPLVVTDPHPLMAAYIIYTSGSTGRPKGVTNSHGAILNRLRWMQDAYQLAPSDKVLQKTPYSFDVSVWEFFWPFMVGATLVVAMPEGHKDPAYLADLIEKEGVTTLHFVPSMLAAFLEYQNAPLNALKQVFCSGEALVPERVARFKALNPQALLHNLYGPTEAAVDVSHYTCDGLRAVVPIGVPIANTRLYIVDETLQPVPLGVCGQLMIAGVGQARCYHKRPGLTAERFIPNPFHGSGSRMYLSGDLVRYLSDGQIVFIGRLDNQVKLRGRRIELGEIENVLAAVPGIDRAVVLIPQDVPNPHLVGYIQVAPGCEEDLIAKAQAHLLKELPSYMVPTVFMVLETIPLTPNGKVDLKALPKPEGSTSETREPKNAQEALLAKTFAELLGLSKVGVDDDFFALGGHSLLAVRLISTLKHRYGITVALAAVFQHSSVSALATHLIHARKLPFPLVALNKGGQGSAWFLVHPAGGQLHWYTALADHLAPTPVFGLEHPGLSDPRQTESSLDELVELYVTALLAQQPEGPYRLAGWSLGGLIAWQMADLLRGRGHRVALVLIDSVMPEENSGEDRLISYFLADLLNQYPLESEDQTTLRELFDAGTPIEKLMEHLIKASAMQSAWVPDYLNNLWHVFRNMHQVTKDATLNETAEPVTLIRALNTVEQVGDGPGFSWQTLCPALKVVDLPGDHYSILAKIGELLKGSLSAAPGEPLKTTAESIEN